MAWTVGDPVVIPEGLPGVVLDVNVKADQILVGVGESHVWYASNALQPARGPAPEKEG